MNRFNDVLVGFSRFAGTQYVSANYAFRAFNDAQNTMQTERAFKGGEDSYWKRDGNSHNRWGDYSAAAVDPVNDSDFWTVQEYSTPHSGALVDGSGRWAAWWANVTVTVPANNNFSAAQTISGAQGTTTGTNARATKETGEPNHAGNAGGASIWYNWTAPANGSVTIDTVGSTLDSLLAVYTGSSVNALTSVASDHDSAGNGILLQPVFRRIEAERVSQRAGQSAHPVGFGRCGTSTVGAVVPERRLRHATHHAHRSAAGSEFASAVRPDGARSSALRRRRRWRNHITVRVRLHSAPATAGLERIGAAGGAGSFDSDIESLHRARY